MGLGFLVPAFLAGMLALGIPILVHLRNKDKEKPYRFPSLMFLEQLPIRTSARQRITDWPLLLLRARSVRRDGDNRATVAACGHGTCS